MLHCSSAVYRNLAGLRAKGDWDEIIQGIWGDDDKNWGIQQQKCTQNWYHFGRFDLVVSNFLVGFVCVCVIGFI